MVPIVLFSQRRLTDPTNPFTHLLLGSMAEDIKPIPFAWRVALTGSYDLVHLQWPEYILRETRFYKRAANFLLCLAWIVRLACRKTPVIETVHNLKPHDDTPFLEGAALMCLRKLTRHRIYLNNSSENDLNRGSVILHGHYRQVIQGFHDQPRSRAESYFLFFGLVRPYKGLETLIDSFRGYKGPVQQLVIAGLPVNKAYADSLETLASPDPRIVLDFRHVPEDELAELVDNAVGVVLPYEYMYNSGALIYALSAATPVLAPVSPSNRAIQREVGQDWLITFDHYVQPHDLNSLSEMHTSHDQRSSPDLSGRSWDRVGAKHVAIYRELLR